jgi:hypothetical protein
LLKAGCIDLKAKTLFASAVVADLLLADAAVKNMGGWDCVLQTLLQAGTLAVKDIATAFDMPENFGGQTIFDRCLQKAMAAAIAQDLVTAYTALNPGGGRMFFWWAVLTADLRQRRDPAGAGLDIRLPVDKTSEGKKIEASKLIDLLGLRYAEEWLKLEEQAQTGELTKAMLLKSAILATG